MESLARTCVRRRGLVLAAWLVVAIGLSVLAARAGGDVSDDFALPGSESGEAAQVLEDAGFGFRAGNQVQVVLHREGGVADASTTSVVRDLVERLEEDLPAAQVVSPFAPGGDAQISPDGDTAYVAVNLPEQDSEEVARTADALEEVRADFDGDDLTVEVGGILLEQEAESGPPSELIGILAAVVVLLIAFGSVFAMGLPIVIGIVGAASGIAIVGLMANVVAMPSFAAPVAAMIAIGVGIDYALLVVTRYREALHSGVAPVDAVVLAQTTAGRSVLFAGTTVVIASLGLVLMGLKLITGVAFGIAASVLVTMLAAVTLLPALLGTLQRRIDAWKLGRAGSPGGDGALARRWSRLVQRAPWTWAVAAIAALLVLSIPAVDLRLGFSDAGTRPESDSSRRAYDLLADGFGPGTSGPLVLAAELDGHDDTALDRLGQAVAADPRVAYVSPAVVSDDGSTGVLQVVPTTGPRAEATSELVHRLRDSTIPGATDGTSISVHVGGTTAAAVDFADYTADRLPLFLTVVLGLAMLLLLAVFRGLFVALKAVVVNLLSITASFGAVVAVFQWGWGVDLLNLGASAPIEAWAPMMLIAIVFGLSMDYEVFLVSRIREIYDAGQDNAVAVSEGLARTARVITAAAAIMVCVFGSFVLGSSRELQLFGFGLAFAVLVDATVVRMVLAPAVMEIVGDRNWWIPRWLERALPHLTIEERRVDSPS